LIDIAFAWDLFELVLGLVDLLAAGGAQVVQDYWVQAFG